jgi:GNAT superfamily N-acetyltransferase
LIRIAIDPYPPLDQLNALFHDAWPGQAPSYDSEVLPRSLAHVAAYDGGRLVGFANVAWDGGAHAFMLDVTVAMAQRRKGLGSMIVKAAADTARERGAEWLHVDFESHLEAFYRACGFTQTAAGLMRL